MAIQATSSNAPGFLAAIVSNVRAAPEGLRRPCSHSCNVRTDTPNSAANSACDKPVRVRIPDIAGKGLTRPTFLRLSSRRPSRISRPMFRPRAALAIDLISDLPEDVSRDVFNDMQREGVIVRPMDGYGLPDYIRITVGTRQENEHCIRALSNVLKKRE